ncbi:hypothetical protein KM043_011315 [Ampulex compressa]|nr:hypothetical protein KM043_011315 [Ampulex compressa]
MPPSSLEAADVTTPSDWFLVGSPSHFVSLCHQTSALSSSPFLRFVPSDRRPGIGAIAPLPPTEVPRIYALHCRKNADPRSRKPRADLIYSIEINLLIL